MEEEVEGVGVAGREFNLTLTHSVITRIFIH